VRLRLLAMRISSGDSRLVSLSKVTHLEVSRLAEAARTSLGWTWSTVSARSPIAAVVTAESAWALP
jgi:hypothetical protein